MLNMKSTLIIIGIINKFFFSYHSTREQYENSDFKFYTVGCLKTTKSSYTNKMIGKELGLCFDNAHSKFLFHPTVHQLEYPSIQAEDSRLSI